MGDEEENRDRERYEELSEGRRYKTHRLQQK